MINLTVQMLQCMDYTDYLQREGLFCPHLRQAYLSNNTKKSFGQQKDSRRPTSPKFSFGKSTRQEDPKRYVNEQIARADCLGRWTSTGHLYTSTDRYSYKKSPAWKMTRSPRKLHPDPPYEYYHFEDDIDVEKADKKIRNRASNPRIGTGPRFDDPERYHASPGPAYNPKIKNQKERSPAYSIAMRRKIKGQDAIEVVTGTDQQISPATYQPKQTHNSKSQNRPKWTMPRSKRSPHPTSTSLYQTYDTTSAVGAQLVSSKPSRPKYTINGSRRTDKRGVMSTHMEYRPLKVSISQPLL